MLPGPVCVSLTPTTVDEVFSGQHAGADCLEVRLDYLRNPEESASAQWSRLPVPVIATCRGRERGGRFEGSIDDEIRILERAVDNGARMVDIDFRFARSFGKAEVIGSYHDFDKTPDDLETLMEEVAESPGSIAKVATMVRSWNDNRRLLELLNRRWGKPIVVIGMGAMGQITRIVGPSRGSALTYTASGRESAPGQVSLEELLHTYGFERVTGSTKLIGIIGNPLGHTQSPALHNRAFESVGLDSVYLKLPVDSVAEFFENADDIGIRGFSVTIPHKVQVIEHLDRLSPAAAQSGAVNTVVREHGSWVGDNTDVHGIRKALEGFDPLGKHVVILGTGGAARAAVTALGRAATITLLSRNPDRIAANWPRNVDVKPLATVADYTADLLINATPIGMAPEVDRSPISGQIQADVVFDMVYNPAQTMLLREAARQGKKTITGTTMFLAQAARQFEIWTGCPAPEAVFRTMPS
jgi:3-dehydroquinate dehydratase/shikimate dehydrogenase